ncbi:MAG: MSHA biogenesis protein MshJ [Paraglaciecola sp.]|jgi:MSHA biogenesis protein MshJ
MSAKLTEQYKKYNRQFLGISMREQVLFLLCGIAVVIGLMYSLLLESIMLENDKIERTLQVFESDIQNSDLTLASIIKDLENDPNKALRQREQVLDGKIDALDAQLQEQMVNLVPANKMPLLLETLLSSTKGLKVVEMRSIPPTVMLQSEVKKFDVGLKLFRHGISLTLEGKYFDIQRFLQKIESLQWQFYWNKFDYTVNKYPMAKVQLELYTLSTNKAFIGV